MEFKEFTEFENPLEADYDVKYAIRNDNPYQQQMIDLLGILEDITDEDMLREYGITVEEYLHPTKDSVDKVRAVVKGNSVAK